MGLGSFFKKITKPFRKITKAIGKGIKKIGKGIMKVFAKVAKPFAKFGIVGQIALAMFMPCFRSNTKYKFIFSSCRICNEGCALWSYSN